MEPNLDCFAAGRKDPQEQIPEPIDECCNSECEKPIYAGDSVYKVGYDIYCSCSCAFKALGAQKIQTYFV